MNLSMSEKPRWERAPNMVSAEHEAILVANLVVERWSRQAPAWDHPVVSSPTLSELVEEYERALAYTESLYADLTDEQIRWRAGEEASGIGWHLGHQAAVAHYLVRNLTAAEPLIDPELDALMDSATPEAARGDLPTLDRLAAYRGAVAERVRFRIGNIVDGNVGAPTQLRHIAGPLMTSVVNHEYQHDQWIGEVRRDVHGLDLPERPTSPWLTTLEGYTVVSGA